MLTCSGQEQLIISTNHSKSLISGIHLAYISRLWHCGGNEGYFGTVCNIHRRSRRLQSKRVADELASQRMYVGLEANVPLYVVCRGQMLIYSILSITRLFGIKLVSFTDSLSDGSRSLSMEDQAPNTGWQRKNLSNKCLVTQ